LKLILAIVLGITLSILIQVAYGDVQWVYQSADENEVHTILAYCLAHASEVAGGKNVIEDLVKSGMVNANFSGYTCQTLKQERDMRLQEIERQEEHARQVEHLKDVGAAAAESSCPLDADYYSANTTWPICVDKAVDDYIKKYPMINGSRTEIINKVWDWRMGR
jgi:hypothetical protein